MALVMQERQAGRLTLPQAIKRSESEPDNNQADGPHFRYG